MKGSAKTAIFFFTCGGDDIEICGQPVFIIKNTEK